MTEQLTGNSQPSEANNVRSPRHRPLARIFGRASLRQSVQLEKPERIPTPLPEGYRYADPTRITREEEATLKQRVGWGATERSLKIADMTLRNKGAKLAKVGVRNDVDQLVGLGTIVYKRQRGELCDLVVSPGDQGQGLGKAIVDESLAKAEARGITSLYMPYLEPTNTLKSYYLEQGFRETPAGEIVRGPDPRSITGTRPKET